MHVVLKQQISHLDTELSMNVDSGSHSDRVENHDCLSGM